MSIGDILYKMDSYSRKLLSDAIHRYQKTGSSRDLREITDILRNWCDEGDVKELVKSLSR